MTLFISYFMFFSFNIFANEQAVEAPHPLMNFVPMVLIFGILYFLMIRPQQKKMKQTQQMLNTLKQGDEVVTNAGIIGTIVEIADKFIWLQVDEKTRLKMLKTHIVNLLSAPISVQSTSKPTAAINNH